MLHWSLQVPAADLRIKILDPQLPTAASWRPSLLCVTGMFSTWLKKSARMPIRGVMRLLSPTMEPSPPALCAELKRRSARVRKVPPSTEEGSGAVELCAMLPLILLIFAAATDLCFMCQKDLVVMDAASAGARYGASNSNDVNGMQAAAQNAAGGIAGFTATANAFCTCSPGGPQTSCSSSCGSQVSPLKYVQVNTSAPVAFPFRTLRFSGSLQLAGSSTMRVSGATQ